MPKCRFLFDCERGDPVSAVFLDETGCMAGTMWGRVWMYNFETKHSEDLAAYSDEGIRGTYLLDDTAYATLTESCSGWRRVAPFPQTTNTCFRTLDKKSTQTVKHVLQRNHLICLLFPIHTTVMDLLRQEHHSRKFKLFEYGSSQEIAPCDFNGESLLVTDWTHYTCPVFRVVHLEKDEVTEITELPRAASTTIIKLWTTSSLVYVVGGRQLFIYDYRAKSATQRLRGHRAEIVALECEHERLISSLSADGIVKLWNGEKGECLQNLYVPEANFFLGFPYFLAARGKRVLIAADEGVYLMELEMDLDDLILAPAVRLN